MSFALCTSWYNKSISNLFFTANLTNSRNKDKTGIFKESLETFRKGWIPQPGFFSPPELPCLKTMASPWAHQHTWHTHTHTHKHHYKEPHSHWFGTSKPLQWEQSTSGIWHQTTGVHMRPTDDNQARAASPYSNTFQGLYFSANTVHQIQRSHSCNNPSAPLEGHNCGPSHGSLGWWTVSKWVIWTHVLN